jgi:Fe-Mn family superoxide dismutase
MTGLSERLLQSHHRNNYGGAVKRLGAIRTQLAGLDFATTPGFVLNGLKREELVATNSMLLHELYFASLGGDGRVPPPMAVMLAASFGSEQRWRDEFVAMGRALGGGSGWVLLSHLPREGRLVNQWAADHTHALALGTPILALDMYEHAYHLDHGADAAAYVDAFIAAIDWSGVAARHLQAVEAASEPFGLAAEALGSGADAGAGGGGPLLLDVRRAAVYEAAGAVLPGAAWCDPARVGEWLPALPRDRPVVVYCVHGHELGRGTALRLRAAGLDAHFLRGGIEAWSGAGRPLQAKVPPAQQGATP